MRILWNATKLHSSIGFIMQISFVFYLFVAVAFFSPNFLLEYKEMNEIKEENRPREWLNDTHQQQNKNNKNERNQFDNILNWGVICGACVVWVPLSLIFVFSRWCVHSRETFWLLHTMAEFVKLLPILEVNNFNHLTVDSSRWKSVFFERGALGLPLVVGRSVDRSFDRETTTFDTKFALPIDSNRMRATKQTIGKKL